MPSICDIMARSWPLPLEAVLTKSNEWVELQPDEQYPEVTVRLWGKSVVSRRQVSGSEIVVGRRLVVHAGQFILSRIDARNGALGLVLATLEGAVVSNDFPAFKVNSARIVPAYLQWLTRTLIIGSNLATCSLTRSNTPDLVGHAAIYDGRPSPCIYPDLMMRLAVDEKRAHTRFVHVWLQSTCVREYVRRMA